MKVILAFLLLLTWHCQGQFIGTNLVMYWDAGSGTDHNADGFFTNWSDVAWSENTDNPRSVTNVLFLTPDARRPAWRTVDYALRPVIRFPWEAGSTKPTNFLVNAATTITNLNSQRFTIYCVAAVSHMEGMNIVADTNWNQNLMNLGGSATVTLAQTVRVSSNLFVPVNPSILVVGNASTNGFARINNDEKILQSMDSAAMGGIRISAGSGNRFSGDLYALLFYDETHTSAKRQQMVNWLAWRYQINTNFARQVVCRGDSLTAGVASSNLMSYPFQLMQQLPEVRVFNFGVGGLKIGTNGFSGTMFTLDQPRLDPIYDHRLANTLFIKAGINDINVDGMNGDRTFGRLTNYLSSRTQAWRVVVNTLAANAINPTAITNYNNNIRASGLLHVDSGVGSRDGRLSVPSDTTYYSSDGLHLTANGYKVIKEAFQFQINQHRRGAFF